MSAADDIGLAADAEALNLADEVRRIMADGHPRTTRQIADLSRLTQGGDDVSKTIYLLRMRGEAQTDVVDGLRLHRLIPGDAPPPRPPAVPRGARQASAPPEPPARHKSAPAAPAATRPRLVVHEDSISIHVGDHRIDLSPGDLAALLRVLRAAETLFEAAP
ncbi:hypothetical protein [Aquabacterium sp.]|uniref:hypothetical protein n=1 Tax=Aquabacterium sp. TaxID=1872578 RepID=UPI0025BE5973|nr:hypothetical protein [Aquabacterium sp.]